MRSDVRRAGTPRLPRGVVGRRQPHDHGRVAVPPRARAVERTALGRGPPSKRPGTRAPPRAPPAPDQHGPDRPGLPERVLLVNTLGEGVRSRTSDPDEYGRV